MKSGSYSFALGVALILSAACRDKASDSKGSQGESPQAKTDVALTVYFDDDLVASLGLKELRSPIDLSELLPPKNRSMGAWAQITASGEDGRKFEVSGPAKRYLNQTPRLYLEQGRASLGFFGEITEGMPDAVKQMARESSAGLIGVLRIDVRSKVAPSKQNTPMSIRVLAAADASPVEVLVDPLLQPVSGEEGTRGVSLRTILDKAGIAPKVAVVVRNREGEQLELDAAAIVGTDYFLKVNRRGLLRLLAKQGSDGLRDVVEIQVAATAPTP